MTSVNKYVLNKSAPLCLYALMALYSLEILPSTLFNTDFFSKAIEEVELNFTLPIKNATIAINATDNDPTIHRILSPENSFPTKIIPIAAIDNIPVKPMILSVITAAYDQDLLLVFLDA